MFGWLGAKTNKLTKRKIYFTAVQRQSTPGNYPSMPLETLGTYVFHIQHLTL